MYQLSGGLGFPSESVDYPRLSRLRFLVNANDVVVGLYGMYDQRFVKFFRESDVFFEVGDLFFVAYSPFEFVESGFPDGYHLLVLYGGLEPLKRLFRAGGETPWVYPHGVEFSYFGQKFFGGCADDSPVAVVVSVNVDRNFGRHGVVSTTAPRVAAQDAFGGEP